MLRRRPAPKAMAAGAAVLSAAGLLGCGDGPPVSADQMPAARPESTTIHARVIDLGDHAGHATHGRTISWARRLLDVRIQPHCRGQVECEGTYVASMAYRFADGGRVGIDSVGHPSFEPARGVHVGERVESGVSSVLAETTNVDEDDGVVELTFQASDASSGLTRFSELRLRPGADGETRYRWTELVNGLTCTSPIARGDRTPRNSLGFNSSWSHSGATPDPIVSDVILTSSCHR